MNDTLFIILLCTTQWKAVTSQLLDAMILIQGGRHVVAPLPLLALLPGTTPHKYFIALRTLGMMAQSLSLSLSLTLLGKAKFVVVELRYFGVLFLDLERSVQL
jgi:hypothetical protein